MYYLLDGFAKEGMTKEVISETESYCFLVNDVYIALDDDGQLRFEIVKEAGELKVTVLQGSRVRVIVRSEYGVNIIDDGENCEVKSLTKSEYESMFRSVDDDDEFVFKICRNDVRIDLTDEEKEHVEKVNKVHLTFGEQYKIKETWVDVDGVTCVTCVNDAWYHYYADGTWG